MHIFLGSETEREKYLFLLKLNNTTVKTRHMKMIMQVTNQNNVLNMFAIPLLTSMTLNHKCQIKPKNKHGNA